MGCLRFGVVEDGGKCAGEERLGRSIDFCLAQRAEKHSDWERRLTGRKNLNRLGLSLPVHLRVRI